MAKELKPQRIPMNAQSGAPQHKQGAQLTREIQARIGHQLRAIYDDVVRQGVPDRFAELLKKIDEQPVTSPQTGGKTEGSN